MSKSRILVVCFLVALVGTQISAQVPTTPNFAYAKCRISPGNYTTNSTYEANLRSALFDLQTKASTESFYNTSAGSGNGTVYGQYYCRGDIDSQLCHDCINQAAEAVITKCPNFKGAVIWYEECTLRYQNISMVGVIPSVENDYIGSRPLNVSEPDKLAAVLQTTFDGIINETAYGNLSHFATKEGDVSSLVTVYCMGQCSPDLNGTLCETCLRAAYDRILPQCCGMPQGIRIYRSNCQLRYDTTAFYTLPNAPPPASSALPSPSPPPPSPPQGGSAVAVVRSRESLYVGLAITAACFFMFQKVYI